MQSSRFSSKKFNYTPYLAVMILIFIACGPKTEQNKAATTSNTDQDRRPVATEEVLVINEPEVSFSVEAPSDAIATQTAKTASQQTQDSEEIHIEDTPVSQEGQFSATIKKDFHVVLSADSVMYLNQAGMMKVWIGEEDINIQVPQGMAKDVKKMSSTIGQFAKITPIAPDFEILNHKAEVCYKIDPHGSEVRYALKPKDEGTYRVSADIQLYDTQDCTGIFVPKSARELTVAVQVDLQKAISKNIHFLEREVWKEFKIFWIALVGLIFGAAIFVIRRFVKNKTGYEAPT